jgi:hypothetical protein
MRFLPPFLFCSLGYRSFPLNAEAGHLDSLMMVLFSLLPMPQVRHARTSKEGGGRMGLKRESKTNTSDRNPSLSPCISQIC